jgi:hypothetical protein
MEGRGMGSERGGREKGGERSERDGKGGVEGEKRREMRR